MDNNQNNQTNVVPSVPPAAAPPVYSPPAVPIAPAPPPVPPVPPAPKIPAFVFIAAGITILIILIVMGMVFLKKKPAANPSGTSSTGITGSILSAMPDYNTDSDSDGYPDYVETQNGLDPKASEYDTCKKGGCAEADLQQTNTKHNVLIILDDSGSMQLGGSPTRMEIAKQAIKNYVSKASSNTQIGLMIYGHKGSNSESDKAVSCVSADVISPVGSVNSTTLDGILAPIKPVGWTPMGYAIKQASAAFTGKEGQNNEIILLTDGEETCNSDPTGQAAAIKSSSFNVKLNVIGFAVDAAAQTQLNQISSSGGGAFMTANNLTELDQKFNDLYENGLKLLGEMKCKSQGLESFRDCYRAPYQKVSDWISKRKTTYFDKKISKQEYDVLDTLSSKVFKQYMDVTSRETQNLNTDYDKTIQQIRGQ